MALLRPCTTSAGFTAHPERERRLDLPALREALSGAGFEIVLDAGVLLLVRRGVESSIRQDGRVLLKTTARSEAEAAYAALAPFLQAHARPA